MYAEQKLTPRSELEARIDKLQASLRQQSIDGALIMQNADLFYFAGTIQQAHLYVPAQGEPLLMVRKSLERAQAESALEKVVPIGSPKQIPDLMRRYDIKPPQALGLELDVLPANLYFGFQTIFDTTTLRDVSPAVRLIRAIKSDYELAIIREAAQFSDQVAALVSTELKEGITEVELAGKMEAHARRLGHQGVIRMRLWGSELFYGHLMAGPSAAVPSYLSSPTGGSALSPAVAQGSSFRPIKKNEPVLFDYVFAHNGYLSDHARIFVVGRLPEDLERAHNTMLELQDAIKAKARPGTPSGDIYSLALAHASAAGYGEHFMGVGEQRIRFVGHGVGLELDEFPFLNQGQSLPLEQGMVIALEPKLIFPGRGVVGIENTHVVTADGLEQLTCFQEDVISI